MILVSGEIDFKTKMITTDQKLCTMIKGSCYQEAVTITNIYKPNKSSKCLKHADITEGRNRQFNNKMRDFNCPL